MNAESSASGLDLVRLRALTLDGVEARFPLQPGDRHLVAIGETVVRGAPLAERLREARTEVAAGPAGRSGVPGGWWQGPLARRPRARRTVQGELLFQSGGHWRIAAGDPTEPLEAPFGGIITDVRPGIDVRLRTDARALLAADVLGGPSSGRLHFLAGRDGHVRAAEIDVAGAGAVLVVGSTIDAEAITRARAVGVRGIVVASLGVKERREVAGSELRARAGVHGLPPFAVLVLEGAIARPIATPIMAILEAIEGRTVAIVSGPACLVFDATELDLPAVDGNLVRITAGPLAGLEGAWGGLAGPYRFTGGVVLEAGWVRMGSRDPVAVPLGDLERFA
ncbi:MAG: hypothetical protein HYX54_02550 [Chloroflexi bacterium]|nr:hypothetical protein [Chloroflexota bacterium]